MKWFRTIRYCWNSLWKKLVLSLLEHPIQATFGFFIVWCLYVLILVLFGLQQNKPLQLVGRLIGWGWIIGVYLLLSDLWNKLMHNWKHRKQKDEK